MRAYRRSPYFAPLAALLLGIAGASAEFRNVDDFESRPLGAIAPQPDWSGNSDAGSVELDPADGQNRVLAVRTNSGILRRPLHVAEGSSQTVFFRLRFGEQQNYSLGLSRFTSPVEFSDFSAEIGMASAGNDLRVWEGGIDHYEDITTLQQATWYNIWIHVDTTADQFQIWVNDAGCAGASAADQLDISGDALIGFRSGVGSAGLQSFFIKTGGGQGGMGAPDGPFYIDDIYLDDGPGVINLANPTVPRDGYLEDFESGSPRGWEVGEASLEPSGGVDDSAWLRGERLELGPIFLPKTDAAGKHLLGNLGQCYGPQIHFSYDGITPSGNSDPIYHNFFIEPLAAESTYWSKAVAPSGTPFLSGWNRVEFYIDTRWSDAEAEAQGWRRLRGSDSWADTLANVGRQEFFKGSGSIRGLRVAGIDNVGIRPSPIPLGGLLAYYPFDGNADDVSGNGYHGTVSGAMLTRDAGCAAASAYEFDGDGDLISIPGLASDPQAGSVAAWVTVESFDLGSNQLNLVFGQKDNLQLGLGDSSIGADGLWVFRHRSGGGLNNAIGPAPELNRWTHVAGVWDGADAILYIDGLEVARVASPGLGASSGLGRIGAHPFAPQNYWHGKIDEVLLYGRALTPAEITALAAAVSYSAETPRIAAVEIDGAGATLHWQPPLERARVEFSSDLTDWRPISEQLNGCRWSGELPAPPGTRGYLRVHRQPEPDTEP